MSLFSPTNSTQPNELFGLPVQFSAFGKCIPICYGTVKLAPTILWFGDWTASAGGGKFGTGKGASGKSGAQQYDYKAALIMGLCTGPIQGISRIFVDKAVLTVTKWTETVTVPSGGLVTPTGAAGYVADLGAARLDSYSHTANDFGSPGSRLLSGTQFTKMTAKVTAPSAGEYQTTGQISSLFIENRGSGYNSAPTISVSGGGGSGFTGHVTVSAPGSLLPGIVTSALVDTGGSGFTSVPTVNVNNTGTGGSGLVLTAGLSYAYQFSGADVGKTVQINYTFYEVTTSEDQSQVVPTNNLQFTLFVGTPGQSPWGYLTSNHPTQALGYTNTAYAANSAFDLGSSGLVSNYAFEVQGFLPQGAGIQDVEPSLIVQDFLTNPYYGCGFIPSEIGPLTEVQNYNFANGIFISPLLDAQQPASQWISDWIEKCSNATFVWSDGVLKLKSFGDKTVIANGYTFTPNTTPIYDLDDDNWITKGPEEPIQVDRPSVRDAENQITIEWANRGNNYNYEPVTEPDDSSVRLYGLRARGSDSLHCICSQPVAQTVAITQLRRSVWIRNQYEFIIDSISFALLEPMDMVTLNDIDLGLVDHPARILSLEEDDNFQLKVTCEDFPWSAASPTLYPKTGAANPGPGYYAAPGSVNTPQFVQLPEEVTQGNQYTIAIALSGGPNWGGAEVFVSTSGPTGQYNSVGKFLGVSTMGALTANLNPSSDPDDTDTLAINLSESFGILPSYTQAQENALVSLIAVGNELLSFRTAALTASYNYNLTHLRRGAYDTVDGTHVTGDPFCFLDPSQSSFFEYVYDASAIGTTLYFKFCSVNIAGQREENIANVEAYPYFVTGPIDPYPWQPAYQTVTPGDAYYLGGVGSFAGFGVQPNYSIDAQGNGFASVAVKGTPSINVTSSLVNPPTIVTAIPGTGGSIPAGNYLVTMNAQDHNGGRTFGVSLYSNIVPVTVSANGTIAITATFQGTNNGGDVYMASSYTSGWNYVSHIIAGATTVTVTAYGAGSAGGVDTEVDHFGVQPFLIAHGGVLGQQIVPGGVTPTTLRISGAVFTTNQFAGYPVSLYAHWDQTKDVEIANFVIASNTADTLTIGNNSAGGTPPDLTTIFDPLDVIVIRLNPIFTANGFSDPNLINTFAFAGLTPHAEIGNFAWVLTGPDAGDIQQIADNDATSITLSNK